ncbi:hypothetical protein B7494_g5468 [Chlorociboria aeruginascens]|nr:hypothetical protein B7494_g5468 [Chlorociboria aeruginascens]
MPSQKGRWRSMRQAVKATIGKHAVDKMRNDLAVERQRLDTALLTSIWTKMDLFLSTRGYKEGDNKYATLVPETRDKTIRFLFESSGIRPPIWQTRLVDKVLECVWTTKNNSNLELFSGEISHTVAERTEYQLQLQLIHELRFPDLSDREYRVTAAHEDTFHWMFAGPNNRHIRKWCLFASWLQSSEKVYWVTGKPGSGKSTLMKFLSQDPRTRNGLSVWAGNLPLVTAHFYFWNSGTQVQMSLHGFYRTVVHAILSSQPRMVQEALPDRWSNSRLFGEDLRDWTIQELTRAFQTLIKKSGRSYRLCLFIDGLDEYEGDHGSFIQQLSTITAANDVKLCLASRPWPIFEAAFSTGAHLMLQDLTFPDIVRFTWSKLNGHKGFQNLLSLEADYASNLILEIADKSQGVFLWVDLVTKSLLLGLTNADGVRDVERRLKELPGTLENLYSKMFQSIEPFYEQHASRYFQIAMAATGQLTALNFFFTDEEDPNIMFETKHRRLTECERQVRYQIIKTRLASYCKGFLEIPNPAPPMRTPDVTPNQDASILENSASVNTTWNDDDEEGSSAPSDTTENIDPLSSHTRDEQQADKTESESPQNSNNGDNEEVEPITSIPEPDRKVAYLHRTAKDFLESPEIRKKILTISPPGFNPHVSILNSYLLLIKTLPPDKVSRTTFWQMIQDFLEFAAVSELAMETPLTKCLDELDKTISEIFRDFKLCGENHHWTTTRWTSADSKHEVGFLSLAAEYNLKLYIRSKLELGIPVFELGEGRPILDYIIEDSRIYPSLCEPPASGNWALPSLRLIKILLDRGEDPNSHFKNSTTWARVLKEASKITSEGSIDDAQKNLILLHWAEIVEVFISHEADPLINRDSPMASKIREIFGPSMPHKARDLEKLLKRTRKRWSTIGKFITPRNWKLEKLNIEVTSLPVLRRLESATIAPPPWSEYIVPSPSDGKEDNRERAGSSLSGNMYEHHLNDVPPTSVVYKERQHPSRLRDYKRRTERKLYSLTRDWEAAHSRLLTERSPVDEQVIITRRDREGGQVEDEPWSRRDIENPNVSTKVQVPKEGTISEAPTSKRKPKTDEVKPDMATATRIPRALAPYLLGSNALLSDEISSVEKTLSVALSPSTQPLHAEVVLKAREEENLTRTENRKSAPTKPSNADNNYFFILIIICLALCLGLSS